MPSRLLTDVEACERLGITKRHLKSLRDRREIPYVKVGRLPRYDSADLERWIKARKVSAA